MNVDLVHGELTERIIGCAIDVHKVLGPGLLESAYEACHCREFDLCGLPFARQVYIPLHYKGIDLDCGYRADIIVDGKVLLEVKALQALLPIHEAQLLTYLQLTNIEVGLLMNFHAPVLRKGIIRRVLQQSK